MEAVSALSCCGASLCWVNGGMTTYLFTQSLYFHAEDSLNHTS